MEVSKVELESKICSVCCKGVKSNKKAYLAMCVYVGYIKDVSDYRMTNTTKWVLLATHGFVVRV